MAEEENVTNINKFMLPLRNKRQIIFYNFLGGISWSLGTLVGFAAIALVTGFFLRNVNLIPIISNWVSSIVMHTTNNLSSQGGVQIPIK